MKIIKSYNISEEIFDTILTDHKLLVKTVDNLNSYLTGYSDKDTIYYSPESGSLICRETVLDYYCNNIEVPESWRQCRLIKNSAAETAVDNSVSGSYAYGYIMKLLRKYYTAEEIDKQLKLFQEDKDAAPTQFHYEFPIRSEQVIKIKNCYKYDINGAHLAVLSEIFPAARSELVKMYNNRKKNSNYKKFPNYFVGMLVCKGYEKTYWYIVHKVTKILFKALDTVGGMLVYSNTDSLVVSDPKTKLLTSKELGDFKLEFSGDTYIYTDKNYIIYKFGDELKGSCLCSVRNKFDLAAGKVVHYDNKIDKELKIRLAENITEEYVGVKELD